VTKGQATSGRNRFATEHTDSISSKPSGGFFVLVVRILGMAKKMSQAAPSAFLVVVDSKLTRTCSNTLIFLNNLQ
jgi:hypothetical protein